jgi:nitrilase
MYAKGIELYCAPTVDDRDSWIPSMRHIACEGRCFVFSACQFLNRFSCPMPYAGQPADDPGAVLIRGGSCIVSPLGKLLAGPTYNCETTLTAEIDPAEIVRGKFDLDVTGHYARADVFQLRVNEAARPPVAFDGGDENPRSPSAGSS